MPLPELDHLLGQARDLGVRYKAGGPAAFDAFRNLVALILSNTVLTDTSHVRLTKLTGSEAVTRMALGGASGPMDPLALRNGWFLRLSATLTSEGGRRGLLKVEKSSYQYQADREGERWLFRYDYIREPGDDHPAAHLQVRAIPQEPLDLARRRFDRVHFPTSRIAIEAVVRLLAEQFGCPTKLPPDLWRPLLTETEETFAAIAHRPSSGPVR